MDPEQVPVLIVGAGVGGLSLSLLLLQQGIHPLLIERRADVSWYPRARNLNFRTLEVFRGLGLSDEIHAAGAQVSRIFARQHLASREQKELLDTASLLDTRALSPEPFMWYCPQSRLEPILLKAARQRGGDIRYSTELISFTQNEDGVTATVRDQMAKEPHVVHAKFLVGADGAHSHVRDQAHIRTQGKAAAEITRERAHELVKTAIGAPDISVEIVEVSPWQPAQRVAEQLFQGRVFLVGDAAHTMPPKEGLGANTAIQSAQNLGWKMAAVLRGHAESELMSTYQTERHPVAWFETKYSMTGPGASVLDKTPMKETLSEFFPIVGYRYRSQAVLSEDDQRPQDEIVLLDREELTGPPGTRVPHIWLERAARRVSTL